ncbi:MULTISPECIES: alpha/beta hydrolase [unclassified Facklamia]|uniref:alpha/beta fold hydrolase n=1 Tax=Aerococcaceae TaxID=186827 RepID=UPI0013B8E920|nr:MULTISPECIES: alpha/beta hydrolase [unclassified Facklamia]NEW64156.1 alpha/beta fold hydrolase [Facklamia sp. 252]NEW67613.1 alpha/beta fold hydrolase [Facklamia sp. 253]QQD65861.1 alpha/beta hydrolase [Aerococcaceae bacterium zg-252]
MKVIFIHGLGQKKESWNSVCDNLALEDVELVDLIQVQNRGQVDYKNLYAEVKAICQNTDEKVNIVGISLGGLLALNYAIDFSDKVNSLVLINSQFKMPKILLSIQNIIFRFIPKRKFETMGFAKENFINIANSIKELDFTDRLKDIQCKVLVINGDKDTVNRKASRELSRLIPNSELVILNQSGHEANIDNPVELAKIINNFYHELL